MAAADLQSDMTHAASGAPGGMHGDKADVSAVARLQDTEQKVESLIREVALLKVSSRTNLVCGWTTANRSNTDVHRPRRQRLAP